MVQNPLLPFVGKQYCESGQAIEEPHSCPIRGAPVVEPEEAAPPVPDPPVEPVLPPLVCPPEVPLAPPVDPVVPEPELVVVMGHTHGP